MGRPEATTSSPDLPRLTVGDSLTYALRSLVYERSPHEATIADADLSTGHTLIEEAREPHDNSYW